MSAKWQNSDGGFATARLQNLAGFATVTGTPGTPILVAKPHRFCNAAVAKPSLNRSATLGLHGVAGQTSSRRAWSRRACNCERRHLDNKSYAASVPVPAIQQLHPG